MSDAQRLSDLLRRSTAQNGGKPPGMRRFLTDHQITETDLHRAGFAKYSELVRSVGFEPVSFTNPPYSRDMMLEPLALLARQLGHFPTSRERNVARRRDQSFPGEKAFRRLSKAAALDEQLRNWCHSHDAFEDVGALLNKRLPSREEVRATVTIRGYVYLMKSGSRFKVGKETTEGSRQADAGTWLPDNRVVHRIATDDPEGVEDYWLRRFTRENKHIKGEWFKLAAADVAAFKRWRRIV